MININRPILLLVVAVAVALVTACVHRRTPYLDSALQAECWLASVAADSEAGRVWPAYPQDSTSIATNLYSGNAGIVLFYLELYHATGDARHLEEAQLGADALIASLPGSSASSVMLGLYTGAAGIGYTLEEVYRETGKAKYRTGALECVKLIHDHAKSEGSGVEWGSVTDIISGNAGIGLFLLYAAETMDHTPSLDLAVRAGLRLIELAVPTEDGLKWPMAPEYPRMMPNFSHGTAGICYFLMDLYGRTGHDPLFETALKGAVYLRGMMNETGLICHHEPGGEDLFYLGWCHGPVGTSRLFYRIWEKTGDETWLEAIKRGAEGILESGIPESQTQGYWNNVSVCCGNAGIAEFFLDLFRLTEKDEYLTFSRRLTEDLLQRATHDGSGIRWIQAEHRARPELLSAQTGFMQGSAGIGTWLLHLDAFDRGRRPRIVFPDTPFGYE